MDETNYEPEEPKNTTWNKELVKIFYDDTKTFCKLCNMRFDGIIYHESDVAHAARVSIFTLLINYTLTDDIHVLFSKMKANHLGNPNIIPHISAVNKPRHRKWKVYHNTLQYFKQKRIIGRSVFERGEAFSRNADFDRFEWIGDLTMRAVYSRVFQQLLRDVTDIPFRISPFLQFIQGNAVLEKLYDQLDMNVVILGKPKLSRNEKTQNALKMKADIMESVCGEIIMGMYKQDAELFAQRGILLDVALEHKPLRKLALHFLIDLAAAHIMHHFEQFARDTAFFLERLRVQALPKLPITYERRRYIQFDAVSPPELKASSSRLRSLNALGHIQPDGSSPQQAGISTPELIRQFEAIFQRKTYFGNEIHGRIDSTGCEQAFFPQIDTLNALYDSRDERIGIERGVSERFKIHQSLKFLYLQLHTVLRPDMINSYARRNSDYISKFGVQKPTELGFSSRINAGRFDESILFFRGASESKIAVACDVRPPIASEPAPMKSFIWGCSLMRLAGGKWVRCRPVLPRVLGVPQLSSSEKGWQARRCSASEQFLVAPWLSKAIEGCSFPRPMFSVDGSRCTGTGSIDPVLSTFARRVSPITKCFIAKKASVVGTADSFPVFDVYRVHKEAQIQL